MSLGLFFHSTPDSVLRKRGVVLRAHRFARAGWTIKDFGPLYVPRKGDCITLDSRYIGLVPEPFIVGITLRK